MSDNKTLRRLRSFVRREGRMTEAQKQAIIDYWPQFGLDLSASPLNFIEIFNRKAPVIVEIGFGMGDSLLEMAKLHSEQNFIGIEVYRPGVGKLFKNLIKDNVSNVRVFNADAVEVLEQCIADDSLDAVNIFFPDPWPKKRHHKRRLIQTPFVDLITTKLKAFGRLHLATDWQEYAEQMQAVLQQVPNLINTAGHGNFSERPGDRPLTKYEKRGERLGHAVWDLVFVKEE